MKKLKKVVCVLLALALLSQPLCLAVELGVDHSDQFTSQSPQVNEENDGSLDKSDERVDKEGKGEAPNPPNIDEAGQNDTADPPLTESEGGPVPEPTPGEATAPTVSPDVSGDGAFEEPPVEELLPVETPSVEETVPPVEETMPVKESPVLPEEFLNDEEILQLIREVEDVRASTPISMSEDSEEDIAEADDRAAELLAIAEEQMRISDVDASPRLATFSLELSFSGGDGTEASPYVISTPEELSEVANDLGAYYILDNDIDMSGITWVPLGTNYDAPFSGHFNGNSHTISNLKMSSSSGYTALFGVLVGATLENLTLQDAIISGGNNTGGFTGSARESTLTNLKLKNCYVTGGTNTGGIAGNALISALRNCSNDGLVEGTSSYTGGLVGTAIDGSLDDSCFTGDVFGIDYVGGLVGNLYTTTRHCANAGDVYGNKTVGGIAGSLSFVQRRGQVTNCINSGVILGSEEVGGISGFSVNRLNSDDVVQLIAIANTGDVVAYTSYAGGIIGDSMSNIYCIAAYNTGHIYSAGVYGGIAGRFNTLAAFDGSIAYCYNAGIVTQGASTCGSIAGISYAVVLQKCYYLTGFAKGVGVNYTRPNVTQVTAVSEDTLRGLTNTLSSVRFEDDIDGINNGFPILKDVDYSHSKTAYMSSITLEQLMHAGLARWQDGLTELNGDPVDVSTGSFYSSDSDIRVEGAFPLEFVRTYNSVDDADGTLGHNWHHSFERKMEFVGNGAINIVFEDGHLERFEPDGAGGFVSPIGSRNVLSESGNGYRLTKMDKTWYEINSALEVVAYHDRNGNTTNYTYSGGELSSVSTKSGSLSFSYNGEGLLASVTDQAGNVVTYGYDSNRQLTDVTGIAGGHTTYAYDAVGRLTTITNPLGAVTVSNKFKDHKVLEQSITKENTVRFSYSDMTTTMTEQNGNVVTYHIDGDGRIAQIEYTDGSEHKVFDDNNNIIEYTDKNGGKWEFEYDSNRNITKMTNPVGAVTTYTYNTFNQLVSTSTDNSVVANTYDAAGNIIIFTDALGNQITYTYADGQIATATDAMGGVVSTTYDTRGNIKSITDALGNITEYEYDLANRTTKIISPKDGTTLFTYTVSGKESTITNPNGDVYQFFYDVSDNLIKTIDYSGNQKTYEYDGFGNLQSETDELGNVTTYEYDSMFNMTKKTYPDDTTEKYSYNKLRQIISSTDRNGNTTTYQYDPNGNITSTTDAHGHETVYIFNGVDKLINQKMADGASSSVTYDTAGNIISSVDYMGNRTQYEYNGNGQVVKVTSPGGGVVQYAYDANGNRTSISDALNHLTSYEYDANNRNTAIVTPGGGRTEMLYDGNGNVVQVKDPLGGITEYDYDANDQVISVKDSNGGITQFEYDKSGNTAKITDAAGGVVTYTYDAKGNVVEMVDVLGATTVYTYNADGLMTTTTDALNNVTTKVYDGNGNVISETNAKGETTEYTYNGTNQLLTSTDPVGGQMKYTYDARGNIASVTDPKGNVTHYSYDANNNVTEVTDALGGVTTYVYAATRSDSSDLISITDARGNTTSVAYDAVGNVVSITNALGDTVRFTYDAEGNVTEVYDALGNKINTCTYDLNGNMIEKVDALGNKTESQYDSLGRLVSTINALNKRTSYVYDALGNLSTATDPENGTSSYTYDAAGNVLTITDAGGNITTYSYDQLGRLATEKLTSTSTIQYQYDTVGRLTAVVNGRGNTINYAYDAAGRMTSLGGVSYTYDANGNVLTVTNSAGTTTRNYDALNRVVSFTDVNGKTILYAYDAVGNLTGITYPDNSVVSYTYDAVNQLKTVKDYANRVTSYTYDKNGRVAAITYPNGVVDCRTYDVVGRVTAVEITHGDSVIESYTYLYDAIGNIIGENSTSGDKSMQYDGNNRVTSAVYGTDNNYGYTYDAAGNILSMSGSGNKNMTYGPGNRLSGYMTESISHDADGNMVSGPLGAGLASFSYDNRNYLLSADGTVYTYDGEGTRISAVTGELSRTYVTDPVAELSRVLMMTDENGTTKYIYGLGLIAQESQESGYRVYHFDYRGSTAAMTDETGLCTDTFQYDPYGKLSGHTGNTRTIFLYVGETGVELDANGLYYMRARYYSPELMRFINVDPVKDGLNWYEYVGGNPIMLTDPTGTEWISDYWHNQVQEDIWSKNAARMSLEVYVFYTEAQTYSKGNYGRMDVFEHVKNEVYEVKPWTAQDFPDFVTQFGVHNPKYIAADKQLMHYVNDGRLLNQPNTILSRGTENIMGCFVTDTGWKIKYWTDSNGPGLVFYQYYKEKNEDSNADKRVYVVGDRTDDNSNSGSGKGSQPNNVIEFPIPSEEDAGRIAAIIGDAFSQSSPFSNSSVNGNVFGGMSPNAFDGVYSPAPNSGLLNPNTAVPVGGTMAAGGGLILLLLMLAFA